MSQLRQQLAKAAVFASHKEDPEVDIECGEPIAGKRQKLNSGKSC